MILTNNKIIVHRSDKYYKYLEDNLVKIEDNKILPIYTYNNDSIEFGRGLIFLLKNVINDYEDLSCSTINYNVSLDYKDYTNLIPNYTLREDQIVTIIKSLKFKRGILQLATGSGKSLCIAGILKYITDKLGYCPPTILLEPTNYMVTDMSSRMESYGIPNSIYSSTRRRLRDNVVYISHPMSLYNDIKENPDLLNDVKILIADEAHHEHSNTWSFIYNNCNNIEISLGFSAYLIDDFKINSISYSFLSYSEAKAISCTGPVLMNLDTSYYIDKGILATPVLIRFSNPANELVWDDRNWQELRKSRLESVDRLKLIAESATTFSKKGYKTLILSNTKLFAINILKELDSLGVGDKAVCSFGSGEYIFVDKRGNTLSSKETIYRDKFSSGDINIMICTSHMFEGADIPNLDVIILAEVGKKVRKIIQGVGRGLRKTKKGKYAYIIDFTDHCGGVLSHHSNLRMDYYKSLIGVKKIVDYADISKLDNIIDKLES